MRLSAEFLGLELELELGLVSGLGTSGNLRCDALMAMAMAMGMGMGDGELSSADVVASSLFRSIREQKQRARGELPRAGLFVRVGRRGRSSI